MHEGKSTEQPGRVQFCFFSPLFAARALTQSPGACCSVAFVLPPHEHVLRFEEDCCFFSHGFFPGTTVRGSCWRSRAGLLRAGASLLLAAASAHAAVFGPAFALRARARGCRMQAARHEPAGGDVSSACTTRYLYSASFCGDGGRRGWQGVGSSTVTGAQEAIT